jgi:hypothetical protein
VLQKPTVIFFGKELCVGKTPLDKREIRGMDRPAKTVVVMLREEGIDVRTEVRA